MNHLGTQTIETERLILRKARPEDKQAMFDNWASDDRVTKFMTWQTYNDVEEAGWRIQYLLGEYANDNFYENIVGDTNLGIIQKYFDLVENNEDIKIIGLSHWVNCNTRDDYQLIKDYWEEN